MTLARRYNSGKLRYDLMPRNPLQYIIEVFTRGAHKYSLYKDDVGNTVKGADIPIEEVHKYQLIDDGANNWRKGLPWKDTIAAVKRHIDKWEALEEIDPDLKTKHLANAAWGLIALMEYEQTHPELDNRQYNCLEIPRIGLDIDGVIGSFTEHFQKYLGRDDIKDQTHWNDPYIRNNFHKIADDATFWGTMPKLTNPSDIPFEPAGYVTSRPIDSAVTQKWLDEHGFPSAPLITVGHGKSKLDAINELKLDIFIDDSFDNFRELTRAGKMVYLMDAPYNRYYNVGHKRIYSLKQLSMA